MPADSTPPAPFSPEQLAVPTLRPTFPEHLLARRSLHRWVKPLLQKNRQPHTPLVFLWGPPGSGKTRLSQALVKFLGKKSPSRTAQLLHAREVYELLRDAEMKNRADFLSLWKQFVDTDLLVLENFQLVEKKQGDLLARLIDQRNLRKAGTLITSTRPPARLPRLAPRLANRLSAALLLEFPRLGLESRMVYLARKLEVLDVEIQTAAVEWLAQRLEGSFRKLQSAVNRLQVMAAGDHKTVTRAALERLFSGPSRMGKNLTMENIATCVGDFFHVSPRHLQAKTRQRTALLPRQVGMYLARRLTSLSLEEIGDFFGRDHTTVIHACKKVAKALDSNLDLCGAVRQLETDLA